MNNNLEAGKQALKIALEEALANVDTAAWEDTASALTYSLRRYIEPYAKNNARSWARDAFQYLKDAEEMLENSTNEE